MGISEAIHSIVPAHLILSRVSPVIFMKAKKNEVEREGMHKAHIIDGAAMCETLSYLEQLVSRKIIFFLIIIEFDSFVTV